MSLPEEKNNNKPFRLFKDFQVGMTSEQIANTRVYVSRAWAGAIIFSAIGLGLGLLSQKFKGVDDKDKKKISSISSDKNEN
ncbi:hypothetical protein CONCODRAFT_6633 [Conidiobolus coronatus NRRL 28638]|uniref:Uncharacterized protein n=1 Tax=Conidiobolus coronatus (strain ATCC 28846 / CBS 209.66 / NRRL 28638) TaxID=796925 RepID=A0A137P758_CONC2|nr:hypothetical protein CONCODRAFT_6633 [Conidiobolus coronatus NRRL 28638]|eukprot:KXN70774.1 hypothetical protein CONCODRAFT_6633 [Conidiobolus coronatus NRRL 28638]